MPTPRVDAARLRRQAVRRIFNAGRKTFFSIGSSRLHSIPDPANVQPIGCMMNTDRIEKKILLRAPQSRVWRAISDAAEFGTWFGMKFEGQFAPGALMRGVIVPTKVDPDVARKQKPYEGKPVEITIDRIEPESLFSFRWHPYAIEPGVDYSAEPTTLVAFTLAPLADGIELTVTESGFDSIPLDRRAKAFAANDGGWTLQMKNLEKYTSHAQ